MAHIFYDKNTSASISLLQCFFNKSQVNRKELYLTTRLGHYY